MARWALEYWDAERVKLNTSPWQLFKLSANRTQWQEPVIVSHFQDPAPFARSIPGHPIKLGTSPFIPIPPAQQPRAAQPTVSLDTNVIRPV